MGSKSSQKKTKKTKLKHLNRSMYSAVYEISGKYPNNTAVEYHGRKISYREFMNTVLKCAASLKQLGIRQNDSVTICMPNVPQAIVMLYAVNRVGAVANMIHPSSAENEIEFYLRDSDSKACLTTDELFPKFKAFIENDTLPLLITTGVSEMMGTLRKPVYHFTEGRFIDVIPMHEKVMDWEDFLREGEHYGGDYAETIKSDDIAVILYSGGTSGQIKGIGLTNRNFNSLAEQFFAVNTAFAHGDKVLSSMGISHGYGLGIGIHSVLALGGRCILTTNDSAESFAKCIKNSKPNYIAAVPSMLDRLLRTPLLDSVNLKFLKGVFCSSDKLPAELKNRFNYFLKERYSDVTVREGYGTTECITISCFTPENEQRKGSIGKPLPDTRYAIVKTGTTDECEFGEFGEICISGPTVMKCYVNNSVETADILRIHPDGRRWLHTGDLGKMDSDGYVYFDQRIKRMIITNGYNVYPSQLESVINKCRYVELNCVIGVPDRKEGQRVKAFVQLKKEYEKSEDLKERIALYCRQNMSDYAIPKEIEFVDSFPKTFTGRIAYKEMMKLEQQRFEEDI